MHDGSRSELTGRACESLEKTLLLMFFPGVSLRILQNIPDLETLKNARLINKNFYHVYKSDALTLIKQTLYKTSPPAWELREIGDLRIDPWTTRYVQFRAAKAFRTNTTNGNYLLWLKHETHVVERLKYTIVPCCQDKRNPAAIKDTLLRIWTFCRIFGNAKEHEGNYDVQQDWIAGNNHSHRTSGGRRSGVAGSSDHLSLPLASFWRGNYDGLSIRQTETILCVWSHLQQTLQQRIRGNLGTQASQRQENMVIGMETFCFEVALH
jgi:hypothetical protein